VNYVRIRIAALGASAALAALALLASSAAALPEFGQCFKHPTHEGKYTNAVCTGKAKKVNEKFTGEFEWRKATEMEAAKKKLSGTGGKVILTAHYRFCEPSESVRAQKCREGENESITPGRILCESEVNQATISGNNALSSIAVTFKGCEVEFFAPPEECAKEIVLNKLKAKLGFINKTTSPRQAGLQIEPATKAGKFLTVTCNNGIAFTVGVGNEAEGCVYPLKACGGDGVIAALAPVNTMTVGFTQTMSVGEAEPAQNVPTKFEGATKPLKELESYAFVPGTTATSMWSRAGLSLTNSDEAPEALEIKAN
jgi:hypothetical protein